MREIALPLFASVVFSKLIPEQFRWHRFPDGGKGVRRVRIRASPSFKSAHTKKPVVQAPSTKTKIYCGFQNYLQSWHFVASYTLLVLVVISN
jgi:hypothetical protein